MLHKLALSVNAGSSSLKISLYQFTDNVEPPVTLILTSSISDISSLPAKFFFKIQNDSSTKPGTEELPSIKDHASGFSHFLDVLKKQKDINPDQITHICHRVVHGGDFKERVVINDESYHHIETLSDLAPLHNGAALSVIKACLSALPKAKSVAYFDTSFHRSIPNHIASYAINPTVAHQRGLKKYGFHGLSYSFILRSVSEFLKRSPKTLSLICLHLGSGASACAIRHGQSIDTSMGLTPLTGLPGATRSGAIDPSLIFHYTNKAGRITHDPNMASDIHVTEAEDILNRKSGWKSLTGTTDFRLITKRAKLEHPASDENLDRLAFDLFIDRILNYIGSYYLKLGGEVDALIFSGGIGEKSKELRTVIAENVRCLGFAQIDESKNKGLEGMDGVVFNVGLGEEGREAKKILVCRTDEQLEMARECALDGDFH
ncbi:Acetokinase family-domain-containing protein [Collybia nuda]|uniref:Probable acetate kinase n=1 Tax=Collybia nuda TaxID=64659 RepID=A0A9P6CND6_9AGAR|nr:Acetokinase family-domain-containing protein [Collybia nuda]